MTKRTASTSAAIVAEAHRHHKTAIRKTALATGLCAFGMLATVSSAHAAPIVTNGSFAAGMTGWTVAGSGITPGRGVTSVITNGTTDSTGYGDIVRGYNGGTNAAFFVDDHADETISQTITLAPHTQYTLSFALFATTSGAANPNPFTLQAIVTGILDSFTNSSTQLQVPVGVWTAESATFTTGAGSTYTLAFDFTSGATPAKDVLLTDISIPEPASIVLLGGGLIGAGIAAARRRMAAKATRHVAGAVWPKHIQLGSRRAGRIRPYVDLT